MTEQEQAVYNFISKVAEEGKICPTNKVIMAACKVTLPTLHRILGTLKKYSMIEVANSGIYRVITITETGKSTAVPAHISKDDMYVALSSGVIPLETIMAAVSQASAIPVEEIASPSRLPIHIRPRFVVCYIARNSGWSFSEIGKHLNRTYSTLIEAMRRAEEMKDNDPLFRRMLDNAKKILESKAMPVPSVKPVSQKVVKKFEPKALKMDPDERAQYFSRLYMKRASEKLLSSIRQSYPERFAA